MPFQFFFSGLQYTLQSLTSSSSRQISIASARPSIALNSNNVNTRSGGAECERDSLWSDVDGGVGGKQHQVRFDEKLVLCNICLITHMILQEPSSFH